MGNVEKTMIFQEQKKERNERNQISKYTIRKITCMTMMEAAKGDTNWQMLIHTGGKKWGKKKRKKEKGKS